MDLENRLKTVGTFVPSNKGTFTVLLVEGYEYRQRYRRANGTIVWECLHANCLKRAETLEGEITAIQNHHHNPDELAEEKRKRKQRLKEDAATSARRTTRLVTATALEDASNQFLASINTDTWRRHVREVRKKNQRQPEIPTDNSFDLPDEYTVTTHGDEFLLADNGDEDHRIIVFGAEWARNLLENTKHWGADGTFRIVPTTFTQLWTVHALVGSNFRPCVYALLPDKSQASYEYVLRILKERLPLADPSYFTTDFEQAEMNAVKKIFPSASIKGCNFHFAQALWRRFQSDGHAKLYRRDPTFAFHCRFFLALAFVPTEDVAEAFDTIVTSVEFEASVDDFIKYFKKNFIGTNDKSPRFGISVWNCHDLLVKGSQLTGNSYEGWHNTLAAQFITDHVNIWELIKGLKSDEVLARQRTLAEEAGSQFPSSAQKVIQKYARMNSLLSRYEEDQITLIQLVQGFSNNLMY